MGIMKRALANNKRYSKAQNYNAKVARRMSGVSDLDRKASSMFYVDGPELQASIDRMVRELQRTAGYYLGNYATRTIFERHAKIVQDEMYKLAPLGTKPKRIGTRKGRLLKSGKRAKSSAIMRQPGNLKRSITIFPGKGNEPIVYIGPRRKGAKYGDKKADGFYGYFQAYGTKHQPQEKLKSPDFINKAYKNKQSLVMTKIIADIQKNIKKADKDLNSYGKSIGALK